VLVPAVPPADVLPEEPPALAEAPEAAPSTPLAAPLAASPVLAADAPFRESEPQATPPIASASAPGAASLKRIFAQRVRLEQGRRTVRTRSSR